MEAASHWPEASGTRRVESGLETIPPDRMVSVSLHDLMFVHQTLAELETKGDGGLLQALLLNCN
ncbi:hypothetical protein C5Y96_21335 [Blastopirellula marina]|uniref:Uncharacterized protein n=1 Tax=Blastopirellula marina TaxID=124 RepID=A0A2S8F1M3_9BACT|nr:hypothetical protein C5Y96_21335 [Blastopirellula marina]RCS44355.1 hypothetical protein DTL36_21380 [Bremerella cremea]